MNEASVLQRGGPGDCVGSGEVWTDGEGGGLGMWRDRQIPEAHIKSVAVASTAGHSHRFKMKA